MILDVAIGLAWIAAIYRVWVSLTQSRTIWRTSFTVSTVCTATAFTLYRVRASLDQALGVWNISGLISHVILVTGLGFLLIYLDSLRMTRVPGRAIAAYLLGAAVVTGIMVISWLVAPLHDRPVPDLLELSEHLSIVVYCISFWMFLGWSLVKMSRTCLRRGRTFGHDDPARSVSLFLIGIAGIAAVPVVILWSSSILIEHVTGREATQINAVGDALLPWPVLLNALGVLSLLTVPYLVEISKTRRQWRHLRPLWIAMIARYPQVHLPLRPTGGPLARMRTRLERAIIEIHDALRLAPVDTAKAPPDGHPIETVAEALHSSECGTRSAADILDQSETREADVRQLISLARAYETSR
jgi:hypothetical protein